MPSLPLAPEGAKRSTSATSGTRPPSNPPGGRRTSPETRRWLTGTSRPSERIAAASRGVATDPWTSRTFSYRSLPARKTLRSLRRPEGDRLDRQGRSNAPRRRRGSRPSGRPRSRRALEPERLAARRRRPFSDHAAGRRSSSAPAGPASGSARSRNRSQSADQPADERPAAVAPRLTVAATSTAQSPGNLLYLSGVPSSARLVVGRPGSRSRS
jgi:hypothetical protein